MNESKRRPIKSRNTGFARTGAKFCADLGISPNMISVASVFFAIISLAFFIHSYNTKSSWPLLIAAISIQLRLLCNLFDGMVAVEYNKATPMGEVYNDFPDRIADVLIILGAGLYAREYPYAMELAWLGSILAITTAYIRVLGDSIGTPSFFSGPMAKPHRMFLLTIASLADFLKSYIISEPSTFSFLYYALWIILFGAFITCLNRLVKISRFKRNN